MSRDPVPPLPHNVDAERAVLGAILLDNGALKTASELLAPSDFFLQENRLIFTRMLALGTTGTAIELITLTEALARRGEIERARGAAYVASLVDGVPRVSNVEHYARIVKEKGLLRGLIHATDAIQQQALEAEEDPDTILNRAEETISALGRSASVAGRLRLVSSEEFLQRDSEGERDWLVQGLLPARSQTILQGRPKVGKSHTLLQLAFDLACGLPVFGHFSVSRPARVAFFELEECEATTKGRFAAMLRAHVGQGPEPGYLSFFTRGDLYRWKFLSRELLGARFRDLCAAIRDVGAELVIFVALRKLVLGDSNDQQVAEVFNDALDRLEQETGAALNLGHHNRKAPADTAEARGLGSTMFSARPDAVFDLSRRRDGLRRVDVEARYDVVERFHLRKEATGDGELIRVVQAPPDATEAKGRAIRERVARGESIHQAAKAEGVPYSTAKRWASSEPE